MKLKLKNGWLELEEKDLAQIEKFGAVHFSPDKVADILLADRSEVENILKNEVDHPMYQHYNKGRLQSEFEIREKVFELAKKNSAQAQELAVRFIIENRSDLA